MIFRPLTLAIVTLTITFASAIHAGAPDFAYRVSGEAELLPVQVFDDGKKTFIQMKNAVVPAVFAVNNGIEQMTHVGKSGQLLSISAVAPAFVIRFGNLSSRIEYIGKERKGFAVDKRAAAREPVAVSASKTLRVQKPPANYGAAKPVAGDNHANGLADFIDRDAVVPFQKGKSTLTKAAAAKLLLAIAGSGSVVKVQVTGRDDQQYVEGLARMRGMAIRDRLLAAGIPLERIVIKEGISRDSEGQTVNSDVVVTWKTQMDRSSAQMYSAQTSRWSMVRTDRTMSAMVARWAASEGWTLVWRAYEDPPILGDAQIPANDFMGAVEWVLNQSRSMGYSMMVQQVSNKFLVIQ